MPLLGVTYSCKQCTWWKEYGWVLSDEQIATMIAHLLEDHDESTSADGFEVKRHFNESTLR